jgi:hypothetical protein
MSIDWSTVRACKDCCDIRKATDLEINKYIEDHVSHDDEIWYCGGCRNSQNEWVIGDMLWDIENEFLVTPCCHTEAAAALNSYDPSAYRTKSKR